MNRKLSVGERNSVIIFCFVVLAILFPDITKGLWPEVSASYLLSPLIRPQSSASPSCSW